MKTLLKIMAGLVVLAALASSEMALMFWLGGSDVKNFCNEMKPGLPVAQLAKLADRHNVRYSFPGMRETSGNYLAIVSTPRSFGRHTCAVRHDNTVVIESRYGYAD